MAQINGEVSVSVCKKSGKRGNCRIPAFSYFLAPSSKRLLPRGSVNHGTISRKDIGVQSEVQDGLQSTLISCLDRK